MGQIKYFIIQLYGSIILCGEHKNIVAIANYGISLYIQALGQQRKSDLISSTNFQSWAKD